MTPKGKIIVKAIRKKRKKEERWATSKRRRIHTSLAQRESRDCCEKKR